MIALTSTDVVRVTTSSANALAAFATYADNTTSAFTPGREAHAISSAATTTVVSSPASSTQRNLEALILNAKGGANTVTVEFFDGSTAYQLVSVALGSDETLAYEDGTGWRVLTALGEVKGVGPTGATGATGPQGATGATGAQGPAGTTGIGSLKSQLGWNPASASSNVLTVLTGGAHSAGLYAICSTLILQTAATAGSSITRTIAITGGPALQTQSESVSVTTGAPKYLPTSSSVTTGYDAHMHPRVIYSDGTKDVTVQYSTSGWTGTPSVDVYASANLVGQ